MTRQTLILSLLNTYGNLYGLSLIERSGGRLKRGAIYVLLDRMEDAGLVVSESHPQKDGPARRIYAILPAGKRVLAEGGLSFWSETRMMLAERLLWLALRVAPEGHPDRADMVDHVFRYSEARVLAYRANAD